MIVVNAFFLLMLLSLSLLFLLLLMLSVVGVEGNGGNVNDRENDSGGLTGGIDFKLRAEH